MIPPIRILLITTHYHPVVGGVETHARDAATGLRRRGHRVTILTTRVHAGPRHRGGARGWCARRGGRGSPVVRHADVIFCPDLRGVGIAGIVSGWWSGTPVVPQGATPTAFSAAHWNDSLRRWPLRQTGCDRRAR
jgi:hypothetical protein